ncbi:uncharacterized protein LAESUDRAFT_763897 [Laetiporus sulphureus 93-53]|uniref:Uncharacterized protein n=1 Tax=Laetiporus sulphureus 93-53 TaxID=1314785 RepID=A0A165BJT2_9APHY|nr:uncharacterized protein LAESUDRAFT_763897 [Laetiporus sulphureus 93-53]KZT01192.1 hypothetical protein LAESUDRAFT_763897 [Laetiporus sulphureus 93-53]
MYFLAAVHVLLAINVFLFDVLCFFIPWPPVAACTFGRHLRVCMVASLNWLLLSSG